MFSEQKRISLETSMLKYSAHLITSATEVSGALQAFLLAFHVIAGTCLTLLMITFS